MRLVASILAIALLATTAWAASAPWSNVQDRASVIQQKNLDLSGNVPFALPQVGGDNIATAVPIPALPFHDTGNTCSFLNDYDVACPYTGGTSPDVVYSFTPAANMNVTVDLCASLYDTKVYIFDGSPATVVACNDDAGCGATGWQSKIPGANLTGGHTYYIVVDGYGTDCGAYDLLVTENVPCAVCEPFDQLENEPVCYDGYDDQFNGGCNSAVPVYSPVTCGTICGTAGTFMVGIDNYRDTDWYELTVGPGTFTYSGVGNGFDLRLFVLDALCPATVVGTALASNCQSASVTFTGPGTFHLWAGTDTFDGVPCGSRYRLTIDGPGIVPCHSTPTNNTSWGALKVLYR